MEIDDSDTEKVDEINIDNDSDVDSDIDVEDQLRLISQFPLSCPIRKLKILCV